MNRDMNKVVIVTAPTRLEELVKRYNTVEQVRFYVEHMGISFDDYVNEDKKYQQSLEQLSRIADKYARVQIVQRNYVPNMIFGKEDIVIALGRDGLVANVMKYLDGQPLVGVNPDIYRWDGVLLPFEAGDMDAFLPRIIEKKHNEKNVTMAEAVTNDFQVMLGVNDLFIGCRTHASARYEISLDNRLEKQSSSGIIISTGLGATGWYTSVFAQLNGIGRCFGNNIIERPERAWDSEYLSFVVREPFPSKITGTDIVFGTIEEKCEFKVRSNMSMDGVIFSDGMENDAIEFNAGSEVTVRPSKKKGRLVTG